MNIQTEMLLNAIGTWPDAKKDEFYERAAILEFDAGRTRQNAELLAYQQMMGAEKK